MPFKPDFISFLFLAMVVTSYIVTIIYAINNWRYSLYGKLISFYLLVFSHGLLVHSVIANGLLIYFPHLSRTAILMLLMMNPISFLAMDKGLLNKKMTSLDILHFVPALIYLLNFLPFYFLGTNEKIELIKNMELSKFNEGWFLPPFTVPVMSFFQIIIYFIWIHSKFLVNFSSQLNKNSLFKIRFFWLYTIFQIVPIYLMAYNFYGENLNSPMNIFYVVGNIFFFYVLLNKREFMHFENNTNDTISNEAISNQEKQDIQISLPKLIRPALMKETKEDYLSRLHKIESLINENYYFLQTDFNQEKLASDLGLTTSQLRVIFKKTYGNTFSEFINFKKIEFLTEKLENNDAWKAYTSAQLAKEIGFKSVNSLYINFKKFTGSTPKEFIDALKYKSQVEI